MPEIENFDFDEIFDENTVKIFNKYVDVQNILGWNQNIELLFA